MELIKEFIRCIVIALLVSTILILVITFKHAGNPITVTEMIHNYKHYVIIEKYSTQNNYYLYLKNPCNDIILNRPVIEVSSATWYHYYVGDTIGHKKQTYFNQ